MGARRGSRPSQRGEKRRTEAARVGQAEWKLKKTGLDRTKERERVGSIGMRVGPLAGKLV